MTDRWQRMGLVVVLSLAGASACGDDTGDATTNDGTTTGSTDSTTGMTATNPTTGMTTSDPTTSATDSTTTTEPTSGTTDEPTAGTTGGSDPALEMQCIDSFADNAKLIDEQCKCLVADMVFPDQASCFAEISPPSDLVGCSCSVDAMFPDNKAVYDCVGPAQKTFLTCVASAACDQEALSTCAQTYFGVLDGCPNPGKPSQAAQAIECDGERATMCKSGETIPASWQCNFDIDCGDESDENACPGSFKCADGGSYVPGDYKCDGYPDCMDMSDEAGCPQFMCMDGMMIPEQFKCDGYPECNDESDELGCPTFMCMSGPEIPLPFKCNSFPDCCDGDPDCPDMSDEMGCPMFMCMDGTEIPESFKCDGEADCPMGEDEAMCP